MLAPLIPLVAAWASSAPRQRLARSWAFGILLAGTMLYAAGEQDRQAWELARHSLALEAYQRLPPSQVDAGWEENGPMVLIPYLNHDPGATTDANAACMWQCGIRAPLELWFTSPDDPRPGVEYKSLAPGKFVLVVPTSRQAR
jgi:hypothetical protein